MIQKKIEILINGIHAYYVADDSIKAAVAHCIKNKAKPGDRVSGRIIGRI